MDSSRTTENRTLTFTMSAFFTMEGYKHAMFCLFLFLYLLVLVLNGTVVGVIYVNKELHQPMNVFSCMLSVNEIYGSTVLMPSFMVILMMHSHQVTVTWCQIQVYLIHTYGGVEFSILALMGYDRYMAICNPLHYHAIMSHSKMCKLAAFTLLFPLIVFACFYSMTLQLTFCGKVIPKLYCVNMELVKNSCYSAPYINIVGLALIMVLILPQFVMILFSYAHIGKVCMKLSKESQTKALNTCIPHLLSLMNYSIGSLFEILQIRFNMKHLAMELRIFLSIYFMVSPALANPLLYGLGVQLVRVYIYKILIKAKIHTKKLIT